MPPRRLRICQRRTCRPCSCMRSVMPYGAISSCVGGWKVPARRSCGRLRSASHTITGTPRRASVSAHISPVGPAPAITTGSFCDIATILGSRMKICVCGAGAVGGHFAAKFAARGHEVSVVARGAHLEAMRDRGITLVHGNDTIRGRVRAVDRAAGLGVQDFVFVTLKANLLGAFAEQAGPLLGSDTGVVFAQNGIPWWYPIGLAPNRPRPPALSSANLEKSM